LKHGSRQQDFSKKEERVGALPSEYSYCSFRNGEMICPQKLSHPLPHDYNTKEYFRKSKHSGSVF
jgi:hypothetical protein